MAATTTPNSLSVDSKRRSTWPVRPFGAVSDYHDVDPG